MATYGDTLNQTFPGISSNEDGELHRTFHTPSSSTKPTGLNFEQQFLFDNAFHSITYQPATVSCQQITTEHLDRLCYSPKPFVSPRFSSQSQCQLTSLPNNRLNPFRAFLIVNRLTSAIVSVNRQACEYFWYTESELKSKTIENLIVDQKSSSVIADSFLSQQSGQTKILAGKIVHVLLGTGERARFSLFIQDLEGEQNPLRFYAFEPIHIMQAKITCDKQGAILSSDHYFAILFHNTMIDHYQQHTNETRHIGDFIPTLKDKFKFKQLLTHRTYRTTGLLNTEKNLSIPLTITLSKVNDENIELNLSIMSNVSGLIMLDETYTIRAYNPYFVQCLLGFRSLELINHHVTEILPEFNELNGTQSTNLSMSTTNEHDEENLSCQSLIGDDEANTSDGSSSTLNDSSIDTTPQSPRVLNSVENKMNDEKIQSTSFPVDKRLNAAGISSFKTTSTPVAKSTMKSELKVDSDEQTVFLQTIGKHKNGTFIGVTYTLRRLDLSDGTYRYCMWLSRDNTDPHLIEMQKLLDHNQSIIPIDDLSISGLNTSLLANDTQTFESKYVITRQRGRGGYGQVYLGYEKSNESNKVVIKFIKKTKVKLHRYVESFEPKNRILFEVAVLKQLKHPNIVEILDAFDTENYVQMIMPLHGQGIDLYEFIEKGAKIDESLASYIFRQVVDAVSYLHHNHIAHQDIKDENLIINEDFHIKLIDFGSAISITQADMYTSNFGGTTEFCCPEFFQTGSCQPFVADIWAMMVTLYVIIFRRYPFLNPDEIKHCQLDRRFVQSRVSDELYDLFTSTLIRQPYHRLTMQEIQRHDWVQQPFQKEFYSWCAVTQNSLEETFLTGNNLPSNDDNDENSNNHSFASLTRRIENQFHLYDKTKKDTKSDKNNLFAYLNCKHASI
ncbi:unnamed protein product [Adineta ricciae]|uniref:Protein kinase domain-containing protein n=1 Tax=Adineta ricciae TaxID=249248 RepID=A0A814YN17_ADIRI|nr:unnamed protein product [Adineta ricciae]CAF1230828.1 unnamed protein product [Adineta ricciae]